MKITQQLVDRIVARAKASELGLGRGLTHKNKHLKIDIYGSQDLSALALCLVDGYDAKYDLVSIFQAALEIVAAGDVEQPFQDQGEPGPGV